MKNRSWHLDHRVALFTLVGALCALVALSAGGCASTSQSTSPQTAPATQPQSAATEATIPPAAAPAPAPAAAGDVTVLKTKDLVAGKGAAAKTGDTVTVNYTGWLTDGTKFDSSLNPGRQPFTFTLGEGKVIQGWDEGVVGMKVGGKRELLIPPDLGYGPQGTPDGTIPPNATLKFEVELLTIVPSGQ